MIAEKPKQARVMRQIIQFLLASLLGINAITLIADEQTATKSEVPKSLQELQNAINKAMEHHAIPGLSIAVIEKNHETWVAGLGYSDRDNQQLASSDTLFRIGSVSKMFVGLAALKLQNEGKLSLMDSLRDIAPEIGFENAWSDTDPVRIIHLLEHTSGWDDMHLPEYASNDPSPLTLKQGLELHPHSRNSRWRPGDRMSYSNSGPAVVAYVIQKVTGIDFEKYIKLNFFDPLEMTGATYQHPQTSGLLTKLYQNGQAVPYWHISVRPSGSINASARDMANFLKFLTERGTFNGVRLMPERLLKLMERPQSSLAARSGLKMGYGITNFTSTHKYFVFNGHNGGVNGGLSELAYEPKQQAGYFISINSGNGQGLGAIGKLIKAYLTYRLKVPKLEKQVSLNLEQQSAFNGYYYKVNPRQEFSRFIEQIFQVKYLQLNNQGGILHNAIGGEPIKYLATSQNTLRLENRSRAHLALLKDNSGLSIQVGSQYYQKISSFNVYFKISVAFVFFALLLIHFIWFFVWLVMWLSKKIPPGPAIQIRLWPFLATVSSVVFLITFILGQVIDVFNLLGKPSIVSLTIMISSISFALCSFIGLIQNLRYAKHSINMASKYFCLFTCLIYFTVTIYLGYFGIIGIRTFA